MLVADRDDPNELFKLSFNDLGELFISAVLLTKLPPVSTPDPITLQVGLADIFAHAALESVTADSTVKVYCADHVQRSMASVLSVMFGDNAKDFVARANEKESKSLGDFFGKKLNVVLGYLRDGDSGDTLPAIESFEKFAVDDLGVPIFSVQVRRQKFVDAFNANVANFVSFQERMHGKASGALDLAQPAVAIEKQLDFLRAYLDQRSNTTGETTFSFLLSDVNFRHVLLPLEGEGGKAVMLSPLSHSASAKVDLPLVLAVKGELDIDRVKIVSPVQEIYDIKVQFSIRRPAIRNVLGATYLSLPPERRQLMSEAEIKIYEDMVRQLQANLCFMGRPLLEQQFSLFASWAIRQVAFCLEEPSFLKVPAVQWLRSHENDGYQRMEDDFFLPTIYERLREKFGSIVSKKPERFGGSVDILFGEIPVELKARRGQKTALIDTIIDEKYRPAGQAAAYAALTGLGCVAVLDVPTETPSVTNLTACVKVVTRRFEEAAQPTSIVVFIFQCDTPRPSDAM